MLPIASRNRGLSSCTRQSGRWDEYCRGTVALPATLRTLDLRLVNPKPSSAVRRLGLTNVDIKPTLLSLTQPLTKQAIPTAILLGAAFVSIVALLIYCLTLAPTVTFVDSGELIVAARFLGVAHPPGFPLYLVLAHLVSLLPIGTIAERINFASALFAAFACGMLTLVAAELIASCSFLSARSSDKRRKATKLKSAGERSFTANGWLTLLSAIAAGLVLTFSQTLWSYATIAEVYTLNSFLILTILFLMLRWRRCIVTEASYAAGKAKSRANIPATTRYDAWLYAAAIVFGLGLGVHHVTIGLLLPALAAIVWRTQGLRFFTSRRLLYAALVSIAALAAVDSYLPLAASCKPILNWGDPSSFQALWWHITGRQYQVFVSFTPAIAGRELIRFGNFLFREFGFCWLPLPLLFAAVGYISMFRCDRTAFWFLILIVLFNLGYALNYEIAEDKDAYYLPTFISIVIACGYGMRDVVQRFAPSIRAPAAGLMLLIPLLGFFAHWPYNNRSHYFIAHDYVENIQSTVEPNGLLLTLDWQVASPMLYTREIEQRRRDIKAIDVQLLRRSWYFDHLRQSYPKLIERSRDQVDAYVSELKKWEQNPDLYAQNTMLTQRIENAFQHMLQSFVKKELEIAPVYVTAELILTKESQNINFIEWLTHNFQAVPLGLIFQLTRDNEFHDPGEPQLQTRGLIDGTIRFADDDVVKLKVLPTYRIMLQSRGQYLAHFHQPQRAAAAFEQAQRFE